MTEDCRTLKQYLEYLVERGLLKEFMQEPTETGKKPIEPRVDDKAKEEDRGGQRKQIHIVEAEFKRSIEARHEYRKSCHALEVWKASESSNKRLRFHEKVNLSFTEEDLKGVKLPHNDPQILTLEICRFRYSPSLGGFWELRRHHVLLDFRKFRPITKGPDPCLDPAGRLGLVSCLAAWHDERKGPAWRQGCAGRVLDSECPVLL